MTLYVLLIYCNDDFITFLELHQHYFCYNVVKIMLLLDLIVLPNSVSQLFDTICFIVPNRSHKLRVDL